VQPGYHATARLTGIYDEQALATLADAVPAKTLGRAEDFGACVAFLCSEHARFVTGASVPIDGGAYPGLV
jgi:3-oxoacyl-[acyl-carrier protein] reductase